MNGTRGEHRAPASWRRAAAWLAEHGRPAVRVITWPLGWLVDVYIWARPIAPLLPLPLPPAPVPEPPLAALPGWDAARPVVLLDEYR